MVETPARTEAPASPFSSEAGGELEGAAPEAGLGALDALVAPELRREIERTWTARINAQGSLAAALADPAFLAAPSRHVALFSDHGVVHARDVALQTLLVLDTAAGPLIPARDPGRLGWMKAYGALVACLHDIGMAETSPGARALHPEIATQTVLGPSFAGVLRRLLADDRGGVAARILDLGRSGALDGQPAETVLREALAMANCHSKSRVPTPLLSDRRGLRKAMLAAAALALPSASGPPLRADFGWMVRTDGPAAALADDVIDSLRALRCADALRQRGTVLKTSGNYEIFVDERTANAVYALRSDVGHLYLLEVPDPVAAGEANVASSQLDGAGDLRISFHHGAFRDPATELRAARAAAHIVDDIQADAIGSFERADPGAHPGLRPHADIRLLLETVDENPDFAGLVARELATRNPQAAARVRLVSSLDPGSAAERHRYLASTDIDWDPARRRELIDRVGRGGYLTGGIEPDLAFRETREVALRAGETLIEAGTPSSFVYVPLGEGLHGLPLGGYPGFTIPPWSLVGVTGVMRGAARNARVLAARDVSVLAIPKGVFLGHWRATYDVAAFAALFPPR